MPMERSLYMVQVPCLCVMCQCQSLASPEALCVNREGALLAGACPGSILPGAPEALWKGWGWA